MPIFDGINIDGLGRKITQTGQEAARRAKGLANSAKQEIQASALEGELNSLYQELGREYFDKCGLDDNPMFSALCRSVAMKKRELDALRADIQDAKRARSAAPNYDPSGETARPYRSPGNTWICPNCGSPVNEHASFCSNCGTRLG